MAISHQNSISHAGIFDDLPRNLAPDDTCLQLRSLSDQSCLSFTQTMLYPKFLSLTCAYSLILSFYPPINPGPNDLYFLALVGSFHLASLFEAVPHVFFLLCFVPSLDNPIYQHCYILYCRPRSAMFVLVMRLTFGALP